MSRLLFAVVLALSTSVVEASNCGNHWTNPSCWKAPPGGRRRTVTNRMSARTAYNPKYELDTAFRVVDTEQQTQWVVDVGNGAGNMASAIGNVFLNKGESLLPWADAIDFGKNLFGAVGIDLSLPDSSAPLQANLTDLVNKLKANIKDWTDQKMFNQSMTYLNDAYESSSKFLKSVINDGKDYDSILYNMGDIIDPLYTAFLDHLKNQYYVDNYAFYLMGPFLSHVTLHYTAALLRSSAQANLYHQNPSAHQGCMMHTACADLQTFNDSMTEYITWFETYRTKANSSRVGAVPAKPGCGGTCSETDGDAFVHTYYSVTYSWRDSWKSLNMPTHTEGYTVDTTTSVWSTNVELEGNNVGDGSALSAAVVAYRNDVISKVSDYLAKMEQSMQTMVTHTANIAGNCAYKYVPGCSAVTLV